MLRRLRRMDPYPVFLCLVMTGMWLVLDLITGKSFFGPSPYHSYTLQAVSWLHGHTWVENNEILELAIYEGRYYVSFPPLPSVVLLPFAAVFGMNTPDNLLIKVYACAAVLFLYRALRNISFRRADAALWSFLAIFSSSLLPLTLEGAVWYQAQALALMLATGAIYLMTADRMTWALLLYALSVAARPFDAVMFIPIITVWVYINAKGQVSARDMAARLAPGFALGLTVALAIGIYNYVRFRNPLEFGHNYLPEFSFQGGVQFSLSHIENNAKTFIWGLPFDLSGDGLVLKRFGFSFLIACPALTVMLVSFAADLFRKRMDALRLVTLFAFLIHFFLLLLHRTFGGYQFGARYCVDLLPYAFLYRLLQRETSKTPVWEWIFLGAGLAFSIYGSVAILL